MKTIICNLIAILIASSSFSQVPEGFNYQAVARDANGNVRSNEFIEIRFTLQPGVTAPTTWIETHSVKTDEFGVFTAIIGTGTKIGGTASAFKELDFTKGDYWIKVEVKDGANYVQIGNLQNFLSVPYAMVSKTTLDKDDADANPTNEIQMLSFSNDTLYLNNGGFVYLGNYDNNVALNALMQKMISDSTYFKQLIDHNVNSITIIDQDLRLLESKQSLDSAYIFNLLYALNDSLTTETTERKYEILTLANQIMAIQNKQKSDSSYFDTKITSNGFDISKHIALDIDLDTLNELQLLTVSGDTVFLSKGNFIKLPYTVGSGLSLDVTTFRALNDSNLWNANKIQGQLISKDKPNSGQYLKWDGTSWIPVNDPAGIGKGSNAATLIYIGSGF